MEQDKTPGTDGLPADFYRVFWNDICDYLVNSVNYAFGNGQLSETQGRGNYWTNTKKGCRTKSHKKLASNYFAKFKAIANRLKKVIPKLVKSAQTGFIKGRFIGENTWLKESVINFAAAKNIPGLLLFFDFEKAFDSLNWFLYKELSNTQFWLIND